MLLKERREKPLLLLLTKELKRAGAAHKTSSEFHLHTSRDDIRRHLQGRQFISEGQKAHTARTDEATAHENLDRRPQEWTRLSGRH